MKKARVESEQAIRFMNSLDSNDVLRGRTVSLKDTQDLVTGDETHLGDTVRITEGNTDLGGGQTLAGELANVIDNILGGSLEP